MLYALILLAQNTTEKGTPEGPGLWQFAPFVIIIPLFYFMLIVPAKKERQQRMQLLATLKKNDEVLTSAGIIGVVNNIKDKEDEVTLKIDDNAKIRVLKSSIVRILNPKEAPKEGGTTNP